MSSTRAHLVASATTLLFAPADSPRRLTRALASSADIVIADLEDAVSQDSKQIARESLEAFAWPAGARPLRGVRVNAAGTAEHETDMELVERIGADVVMVPKASVTALHAREWAAPLIPIVETPRAVRETYGICCSPGVVRPLFGSIDLGSALGVSHRARSDALLFARSSVVLDCAAAGLSPPIDGVHLDLADQDGLEREAIRARELGFAGKACVHPDQLATVARCFAPTAGELAWAELVLAEFEAATASGCGVVVVDGEMVDAPVAARARALLRQGSGEQVTP